MIADEELSQSRIEFAVQNLISNQNGTSLEVESEEEEDDDRIMAYLERTDIDARKAENNCQQERYPYSTSGNPKEEESSSLSGIDLALNNFLGGFTELKSEISQLKDTIRSS